MVNYRKNNRRNSMRRNRKNRNTRNRRNRRNNTMRRNNMMGGEYSMPAPVNDNSLDGPRGMSLNQGQQFASFHANQHGGALVGGPYPGSVTDEALISPDMATSARVAPLNAALNEIRGMSDQAGGRRRRSTRKNRKNRKASRKNRKASRKNRKNTMRRRRNNMMGGMILNPASVSAPGLLLSPGQEAKALSGMNAEWKLAENPRAFAPGV